MKNKLTLWALATLVVGAFSFLLGKYCQDQKTLEDACHMSDLIRCYQDHIAHSSVEDYGLFEELQGIFLYDDVVSEEPVRLENYSWCY